MYAWYKGAKVLVLVGFMVEGEEENISGACAREGSLEFMSRS